LACTSASRGSDLLEPFGDHGDVTLWRHHHAGAIAHDEIAGVDRDLAKRERQSDLARPARERRVRRDAAAEARQPELDDLGGIALAGDCSAAGRRANR
jgi:hypothetical protein